MAGTGGQPSDETVALMRNRNVAFDADGIADLRAGRIDPRLVSVLSSLAQRHTLTVSAMSSDHPKFTTGGSISNHYFGRALDIATIDGRPVGPGNMVAKEIAVGLGKLELGIRPSEIGSPWQIAGAAYFSDAGHQNHLHIGFDDPVDRHWRPPAEPAASRDEVPEEPHDEDARAVTGGEEDASPPDDDVRDDGGSGDTEDEADDEADEDDEDEDPDEHEDDSPDEDGEEPDEPDEDDDDEDEDEDEDDEDDEDHGDEAPQAEPDDEDADQSDQTDQDADPAPRPRSANDAPRIPVEGSDYPGAGAGKDDLARWMAGEAQRRGLPPELPVMASLVESGLADLDGGDADSVGFFQMRVGIWNSGDYAGYPDDPKLQLDWFLDQAQAVKEQRLARSLPVDDPRHYGEWIADIERPAAQYRGRYQLRLEEAQGLLDQLTARPARADGGSGDADVVRLKLITPEEARRARGG